MSFHFKLPKEKITLFVNLMEEDCPEFGQLMSDMKNPIIMVCADGTWQIMDKDPPAMQQADLDTTIHYRILHHDGGFTWHKHEGFDD